MSSSVITQSDGSALKPQTKSWFKRFKPALWLAPFALFFYLFQLAPMVWVLINSFFYDDELSLENYCIQSQRRSSKYHDVCVLLDC